MKKNNIYRSGLLLAGILVLYASCNSAKNTHATVNTKADRPNVVLILTDDLGFSDLGVYGSEIATPNLDALAKSGVVFREFYNVGICAPTRATLITGQYQHDAGVGHFSNNLGIEAYQGYLNKKTATIAETMKENGYATFLSGKWHLGSEEDQLPNQRGFDQFYGFAGGASHYFSYNPANKKPTELIKNNEKITVTDPSYYMTDAITNEAIGMIKDEASGTNKPFFLYLAYNAPHWPLQALPEDIAKYKGKFDEGWDVIRQRRHKKLMEKGIVPKGTVLSGRPSTIEAWETLSAEDKNEWAKRMEVHAAMIDRMDQNVGKLVAHLKATGAYDNTVFFFLSDNGAAGDAMGEGRGTSGAEVGTAESYSSITHHWAYASNSPFTYWKAFPYEGGISAPFIASYPKRLEQGKIVTGRGHLIDIYPTILELTGSNYVTELHGNKILPLAGHSLVPNLDGHEDVKKDTLFFEWAGNKAVRAGKWKILKLAEDNDWNLYDIEKDRSETQNVAERNKNIVAKLEKSYKIWAKTHNVVETDSLLKVAPGGKGMVRFRENLLKTIDHK